MSKRLGIEVKMTNGRRITDEETLDVVKMILPGLANKNIVAHLQKYGCNAIGLTGADGNMIVAEKRPLQNGIDFGFVGDIIKVETGNIQKILSNGFVPVFTAMTHDGKGQLYNTNADTIASSLAVGLATWYKVELFYCFEKPGVLSDLSDENSLIGYINSRNIEEFQSAGIIQTGMLPKIDNALEAVRNGVNRVHICHYKDIERLIEGDSEIGTIISE
jgi:acetylglutamate kinase